jgi:CysZ protein
MKEFTSSFTEAWSYYKKDKYILLFSFIPVLIGLVLFSIIGDWLFVDIKKWGFEYINSHINSEGWLSFLSTLLTIILGFVLLLLINFTFLLIVSLIASPFNDLISARVEKLAGGESPIEISRSLKQSLSNAGKIVLNEIKKILMIAFISIIGFSMSFFFPPISFIVSALLLAITFLDYSWCRHEMSLRECLGNLKESFIMYFLGGSILMAFISIPILNLFLLSYGVVFFTILFTKKRKLS